MGRFMSSVNRSDGLRAQAAQYVQLYPCVGLAGLRTFDVLVVFRQLQIVGDVLFPTSPLVSRAVEDRN